MNPEDLSAELRALLAAADPVPDAAMAAARAAIGWRDVDSELAALVSDTAADQELAHVRGGPPRILLFRAGDLTVDLEVSADRGQAGQETVRLLGQLDPPGAAAVIVQSAAGSVHATADDQGRFSVQAPAGERLRVVIEPGEAGPASARAVTEWFRP
jgi:hypothetical protein